MPLSHFDERSGIVDVKSPWGRWWQTVAEVFVEVNIPPGTPGKDCKVIIQPKHIECRVKDKVIFSGNLFKTVQADECTWSVEERQRILILLEKAEKFESENLWVSLLDHQFLADPLTQNSMLKKLDLEKFQMEHPGFDFSGADLSKCYENPPYLPE
ncbi:nudC domain-containing protein 2-like [Argiope bruennichi]|uniref:nudC domain-containing protein 2-like n=1 Tax=Argiope bruennichi TaxID=94029 RepID=UPI0024957E36|nr:nudC domain-containing protein 2-like [Argiope bruennichi]